MAKVSTFTKIYSQKGYGAAWVDVMARELQSGNSQRIARAIKHLREMRSLVRADKVK